MNYNNAYIICTGLSLMLLDFNDQRFGVEFQLTEFRFELLVRQGSILITLHEGVS